MRTIAVLAVFASAVLPSTGSAQFVADPPLEVGARVRFDTLYRPRTGERIINGVTDAPLPHETVGTIVAIDSMSVRVLTDSGEAPRVFALDRIHRVERSLGTVTATGRGLRYAGVTLLGSLVAATVATAAQSDGLSLDWRNARGITAGFTATAFVLGVALGPYERWTKTRIRRTEATVVIGPSGLGVRIGL